MRARCSINMRRTWEHISLISLACAGVPARITA